MHGRHVHAVFVGLDPSFGPQAAAIDRDVRRQLAAIGISTTLLPLTREDFRAGRVAAKAARADIVWGGGNVNEGDPVSYLRDLMRDLPLPRDVSVQLDRVATLSASARERAAAALARRLERESLFAVYEDGAIPELVSPRLGCIIHQPEYPGVDLAALCLKQ